MIHVLRHYLPLRKALLVLSETVLLSVVLALGMTSHLWSVSPTLQYKLAELQLSPQDAINVCLLNAVLAAVLTQVTISFNELYDFRISNSFYDRAARFMGSAGSAVLLVTLAVTLAHFWGAGQLLNFPGLPFAQAVVLLSSSLGGAFVGLYVWRNVFHALMRHTSFHQRLIILGSGRMAERMEDEVKRSSEAGYEIVGHMAPDDSEDRSERRRRSDRRSEHAPAESEPSESAGPEPRRRAGDAGTGNPWFDAQAGTPSVETAARRPQPVADVRTDAPLAPDLFELAQATKATDIVVAYEDRRGRLPIKALLRCRMAGIVVHEAETFFEHLSGKIPAEAMRPSYLIFNQGFVQHALPTFAKRAFDILFAIVVFLLALPVMLAAAIAVRLDSPGPVLFRQVRTGADGKPFTLCKFRSMRADAEKLSGPVWAQKDDPRITKVGSFLRKTRIDELPQLFNVLAGSMSFVGPRPERPSFVDELSEKIPYYQQRHIVKPGLTGWAQINYPYGNTMEDALQKLQYDLFYIKYQSFLFDLSIVANTVKTVVLRKGT